MVNGWTSITNRKQLKVITNSKLKEEENMVYSGIRCDNVVVQCIILKSIFIIGQGKKDGVLENKICAQIAT